MTAEELEGLSIKCLLQMLMEKVVEVMDIASALIECACGDCPEEVVEEEVVERFLVPAERVAGAVTVDSVEVGVVEADYADADLQKVARVADAAAVVEEGVLAMRASKVAIGDVALAKPLAAKEVE